MLEPPQFLIRHPLRVSLGVLAALFTVTGASALLAEQIFEKLLSTVVGASTPAGAIVLAVFFLGLTLGGIGYAAFSARIARPLVVYGLLEGFVGLWALFLSLAFAQIQAVSGALVALGGDSTVAVFVLRLLVGALWILPPTTAMGATFPAVVAVLEGLRTPRLKQMMARYYALNLLGAVAGAASGPYVLLPRFGLGGTLLLIAASQALTLATVALLNAGLARKPVPPRVAPSPRVYRLRALVAPMNGWLVLVGFSSGFLFFSFEVVWVHLIGCVIGTTVYAFANMLSAVLAALFIGGLAASAWLGHRREVPPWIVPLVMALAGYLLALSFAGWDNVPLELWRWGSRLASFGDGEMLRFILIAGLIVPPAAVMGALYPLLFRLPWFERKAAAASAGILGAVNAAGSILGALLTGFVLLPALGSESLYRVLVFALVLLGVLLALHQFFRRGRRHGRVAQGLLVAIMALLAWTSTRIATSPPWDSLALTSGMHVYFRPGHVGPQSRLLFWHEDTRGGFTTVVAEPSGEPPPRETLRTLLTNGKFQGNDGGEMAAQIGVALVPIVHQPRRGEALVIGLGSGQTAAVVHAAGYRHVDIAEIAPGIVAAARQFFPQVNHGVLDRPNVDLHLEDGRNYLLRSAKRYDLISMEVSSIWFAGVSNLYSREFFALAKDRLAADGVFQQWIQFHHISPEEILCLVATLSGVFAHVSVWYVGNQGILVASASPLRIDPALVAELRTRSELQPALEIVSARLGRTLDNLPDGLVLDGGDVDRLAAYAREHALPLNTDGNRFLEYATPRHNLTSRPNTEDVLRALFAFVDPADVRSRKAKHGLDYSPAQE